MPTYEYRCKSCGHQFDIVQGFADDSLTVCPECGEASLKKVFGNVGITFKGSGFYKTDSRSAGSFGSTKDADKSDKGSSSSTSSSKDSSSSSSTSPSTSGGSGSSSSSTASTSA
ncbi:MAG: FmdB family zinc ribbon protein [Acidimicrobiales bacterium]